MHRCISKTFLGLLSAAALLALLPSVAQARHNICPRELLPATYRLHEAYLRFESVAQRRPLPRHEVKYIELMTQHACRLVDVVEERKPDGLIRAKYNVLKAFTRVVDRRLERRCEHGRGGYLMRTWQAALDEFYLVGCLINGCRDDCPIHRGRGHRHRSGRLERDYRYGQDYQYRYDYHRGDDLRRNRDRPAAPSYRPPLPPPGLGRGVPPHPGRLFSRLFGRNG